MELESIYALIDRFECSSLTGLELDHKGVKIKLERTAAQSGAPADFSPSSVPSAPVVIHEEPQGDFVRSPLVGTFYTAPQPDAPLFVQVGDRVKEGQTLCILEAMKMMSELPAPCDCVVEDVLLSNGELAAYDAPLFRIRRL